MSKRLVLILIVVLVALVGVVYWMNPQQPSPSPVAQEPIKPVQPRAVTVPGELSIPALTVEQYSAEELTIRHSYTSGILELGASFDARLAKKEAWAALLASTAQSLMRLSVPASAKALNEDRVLTIFSLTQALKAAKPDSSAIQKLDAHLQELWQS